MLLFLVRTLLLTAFTLLPTAPRTFAQSAPKTAPAASHSKNVRSVTITSVDADAVHAVLPDGTTLDANIKPGSIFLAKGVPGTASDFLPGTKALLRTRTRASDGTLSIVMLSDMASADAINSFRKRALTGHVVSISGKYLVVRPDTAKDATPLTLDITPKTLWRHGGAAGSPAVFPVEAPIAVVTRGLPSGLLMATIVSDTPPDAAQVKASLKTVSLSGTAIDIQADKGLLQIAPKTKPRQTIAVTAETRIKIRKTEAALRDITPGMHIAARLTTQRDSDGHAIAASLSAYDAPAPLPHKKAAAPVRKARG